MKKLIYTAIFGPYEELKTPIIITEGWDYICFTDQPLVSKVWKIVRMAKDKSDTLMARQVKIIPPLDYDISIWIDGAFTINCDLNKFWEQFFIEPFTVFNHPIRNCVYKECQVCIMNKRAPEMDIASHMDFLHQEKIPANNGLIQSGVLLRRHTKEVIAFCEFWHLQIRRSTRDQIGFAYCEHKMQGIAKHSGYPFDYRRNDFFKYKPHYNRRKKYVTTYRNN